MYCLRMYFITLFFCLTGLGRIYSQQVVHPQDVLNQLGSVSQEAVESIAMYPEAERASIFEAAAHPQILVRMQNVRVTTEEQFKTLLSSLPEKDQRRLFNLTPYPELIALLCTDRSMTTAQEFLSSYPDEVREDGLYAHRNYFDFLVKMNNLSLTSEAAFGEILRSYPELTQKAYTLLVSIPEVVSLLVTNMNLTVLLGDLYQNYPQETSYAFDSLSVVVAERRTQELNAWRQNMESNPEAMEEYQQASEEFVREQGYDDVPYDPPVRETVVTDVTVHHVWRPYPYWFGQPWWYTYECWYPYPWWRHAGYYYRPDHVIVIIALPSDFFMHWHFRHHHHFYHYPHFTNNVINHYYGHRNSYTSVSRSARQWENEIRRDVPEGWFYNDGRRVERIREYGKFRIDYEAASGKVPGKVQSQKEYLKDHADKYPTLKPVLKEGPDRQNEPKPIEPQREKAPQYQSPKEPEKHQTPPPVKKERDKEKVRDTQKKAPAPRKTEPVPTRKTQPVEKAPRKAPEPKTSPGKQQPARKEKSGADH